MKKMRCFRLIMHNIRYRDTKEKNELGRMAVSALSIEVSFVLILQRNALKLRIV